jgi:hypothetical protein
MNAFLKAERRSLVSRLRDLLPELNDNCIIWKYHLSYRN